MGDFIEKTTAEDIEKEKKAEKKGKIVKILALLWLAAGLGCFIGGGFAGLNWLVIFGGCFLAAVPIILSGVMIIKIIVRSGKKEGGNKKGRIMKAVVCALLFCGVIAFMVLGNIFSELYFIGLVVCAFALVVIFFAWRPDF